MDQFWAAIPAELRLAQAAYAQQIDRQYEIGAWIVAHLLQPWTKRGQKITPRKLLGKDHQAQFLDETDFNQFVARSKKAREEREDKDQRERWDRLYGDRVYSSRRRRKRGAR